MKLTEVGIARLTEHLQNYIQLECPLCKGVGWNAADEVMQLTPFSGKKVIMGGDIMPILVISCSHCGYTYLFNAISAGVLEVVPSSTVVPLT